MSFVYLCMYLTNMIRAPTPCPCHFLQDNDGASRKLQLPILHGYNINCHCTSHHTINSDTFRINTNEPALELHDTDYCSKE